jgi:cytochrome c556
MRFALCLVTVFGLILGNASVIADEAPKKRSPLMEKKLKNAQAILEGIAVLEFATVEKSAEELIQISKEAGWRALETPRYDLYSGDFRRSAETLIKQSKAKNVEAATLAYMEMTMTCVKCHQHIREEKKTSLPLEKYYLGLQK